MQHLSANNSKCLKRKSKKCQKENLQAYRTDTTIQNTQLTDRPTLTYKKQPVYHVDFLLLESL